MALLLAFRLIISYFDAIALSRIIDVITNFQEISQFSRVVDLETITNNNYILLPTTYLDSASIHKPGFLVSSSDEKLLQEIADIKMGTRSPADAIIKGEGHTRIIQGRNLSSINLTLDKLEAIRIVKDLRNEVYAQAGDILIQRIGKQPSVYLVNEELEGTLIWDTVYVIRLKEEYRYVGRFIVEFMNSSYWYEYLNRLRPGAMGAPTLSLLMLKEAKIYVPKEEMASMVISSLSRLNELENDIQDRLTKLQAIKQNLFQIEDQEVLEQQMSEFVLRETIVAQTVQQAEDFDYQIRNLYPYILAFPYRLLNSHIQNAEKYREQLRFSENLMAFFGSVTLALIFYNDLYQLDDLSWLSEELPKWWQSGISPGSWQEMGRRISQYASDENTISFIKNFMGVWFKGKGKKPSELSTNLSKLGGLLNDFKHGRGPKTPPQYASAINEADDLLTSSLKEVSLITQYPIHLVTQSQQDWRTKQMAVTTLVHMGDHPAHRQHRVMLNFLMSNDHLYIEASNETWISLYPFISVQYCPQCESQETYMVDRWDGFGKRFVLKSFERGHVLDTSKKHTPALQQQEDFEHLIRRILAVHKVEVASNSDSNT